MIRDLVDEFGAVSALLRDWDFATSHLRPSEDHQRAYTKLFHYARHLLVRIDLEAVRALVDVEPVHEPSPSGERDLEIREYARDYMDACGKPINDFDRAQVTEKQASIRYYADRLAKLVLAKEDG